MDTREEIQGAKNSSEEYYQHAKLSYRRCMECRWTSTTPITAIEAVLSYRSRATPAQVSRRFVATAIADFSVIVNRLVHEPESSTYRAYDV